MANFFIRRPIVAIVIAILTVIVGVITIVALPVAQFPNIAPPEIRLQANYPVQMRRLSSKLWPHPSSSKSVASTT
jgi:Cu/Ag efflux pump CusA